MKKLITLFSLFLIIFLVSTVWTGQIEDLFDAIIKGDKGEVAALIKKGADVKAKDHNGKTPLHLAANKGHIKIVKLLIEKGADVNAKMIEPRNYKGTTPLHSVAWGGHTEIARLLIKKGADVNAKLESRRIKGKTPLHYAAEGLESYKLK